MNTPLRLFALASLVTLAACGGGSDDAAPEATVNGKFGSVSVFHFDDPGQSLTLLVSSSFDGTVTPAANDFTMSFVLTRNGPATYQTGAMTFTLTKGSDGVSRFIGKGSLTLPAQPVGTNIYTLRLDPASIPGYAFVGTIPDALSFSPTVIP
jgi:hypothetical protein